jgi:hypothetical protein
MTKPMSRESRVSFSHLMITMNQEQAGFENHKIEEEIIEIEAPVFMKKYEKIFSEDKIYQLKDGRVILCDTAVKLMQKLHQLWSGTLLPEGEGVRLPIILSYYKAEFIKERFEGKKIAIFYLYRAERIVLTRTFDLDEDGKSDNISIHQVQSGSMGVNLSWADYLVFMNISFSAMQYFQARARTGSNTRTEPQRVVWIFAKDGIEKKIYQAVTKKKDYTLSYFKRDYMKEIERIKKEC